jgi:hypothetical protein
MKQLSNPTETNEILSQKIVSMKANYMKNIFALTDAVMDIYKCQNAYFVSSKLLLEELKNQYANIIKYYETPTLAIKCIDNDIYVLNSLIMVDNENPQSVSYYENYDKFRQFYENQLYKNREDLLEPKINYEEYIKPYLLQPNILLIEKEQYEIYDFKIFLFYSYNQFDIWLILFKTKP